MDLEFTELKLALRRCHNHYFYLYKGVEKCKDWCFRVIDMMVVVKYSNLTTRSRECLLNWYRELLVGLKEECNLKNLIEVIQRIEKEMIYNLISGMSIIEEEADGIYKDCVEKVGDKHDEYNIVSLSIYFLIFFELEGPLETYKFEEFWKKHLISLFSRMFGIPENLFLKEFSRNFLCETFEKTEEPPNNIFFPQIIKENIFKLFDSIFQSSKNYRFFLKASKIHETFTRFKTTIKKNMKNMYIKVCNTHVSGVADESDYIVDGFTICNSGLKNISKNREDGMVLFGNHSLADIKLRTEEENNRESTEINSSIDDISFAIYFNGDNYLMLDCDKYNYSSVKMIGDEKYLVENGTLIDLARQGIMHLISYDLNKFQVGKESWTRTEMKYEYLTGPLCKKIDNISKEIKASSQKNKKIIKFGRGGKGREVDEYMNLNRVTSTEHISFGFDDNDNFFAKDLNSKHGSYLLLKNRSQVYDKLWSNIKPLFKTLETPEYPQCSTLYICNSCFYFELYKPSDSHN
jgi:hypothetical protein